MTMHTQAEPASSAVTVPNAHVSQLGSAMWAGQVTSSVGGGRKLTGGPSDGGSGRFT
jgi:hypothetical protein